MKKRLFQVLVFASIFSMNSLLMCEMLAVTDVAVASLVDNSGQDKIVNIMPQ